MITQLSLNVSAVADEVLAETALRHFLSTDNKPVLSRDRMEALELMVHASFARMCLRMIGCVVNCSCGCETQTNPSGQKLLSLDIEHEPTASALTWTHALEHALVMDVLSESLSGVDPKASEMYGHRSNDLISGVMRDVSFSGIKGTRIVPHMY